MQDNNRVTAVFDRVEDAREAVDDLHRSGIPDERIGFVTRSEDDKDGEGMAAGVGKGAAVGGGIGGALGLAGGVATGFIPGAGPFIAAGILTSWLGTVAGSAVSGAAVAGTARAVAGALEERAGYSKGEASYYGSAVEKGGTLVGVEAGGPMEMNQARTILAQHHGSTHQS